MIGTASWWTANHLLVVLNAVLAAAALATAGVGIATIRSSNRVAKAAEDQATRTAESVILGTEQLQKEREALATTVRPILIDTDRHEDENLYFSRTPDWSKVDVALPLLNIGPGPAFVREAFITTGPGQVEEARVLGPAVVPPRGTSEVFVRIHQGHYMLAILAADSRPPFAIGVRYSDVGEGQKTQSVIRLSQNTSRPGAVQVDRVELYHCDDNWVPDNEPFVSTLLPNSGS